MSLPPALAGWTADMGARIEAALDRWVPAEGSVPSTLGDAMRYSLLAGGKRLRPLLTLGAADACAGPLGLDPATAEGLAMPAACALECIHTYSLMHDDLPAMDNDTLRRGRPTSHVVYGEALAILAGDALLTQAFVLLAREPASVDGLGSTALDARRIAAIRTIADAAGGAGMVGGQALDLAAVSPNAAPLDADGLRAMHLRKTGALIRASGLSGAIMAGADAPMLDAIGRYGDAIGLAFQIVDDILDVEGASEALGKTAGKDAAAGKPTYPALYGIDESRRLAARCLDDALAALDSAGVGGRLPDLARWVIERTH